MPAGRRLLCARKSERHPTHQTDRICVRAGATELEAFFMAHLRAQASMHKRLGWSRARGVQELQTLEDYLGIHEP